MCWISLAYFHLPPKKTFAALSSTRFAISASFADWAEVFRPEFVKRYKIPLSSDAYSNFAKHDPQREINNREVLEATNYLLTVTIPTFGRWLDQNQHLLKLTQHL